MPPSKVNYRMRLKDLPPSVLFKLRSFFDADEKWKELAFVILDAKGNEKYSQADLMNFQIEFLKQKSPIEALIRDWSYDNASVLNFLQALVDAQRWDVLSWMMVDKMKEITLDEFDEQMEKGWDGYFNKKKVMQQTSKAVETSDNVLSEQCNVIEGAFASGYNQVSDNLGHGKNISTESVTLQVDSRADVLGEPAVSNPNVSPCVQIYKYRDLSEMTDNWNAVPVRSGGRLLGSGGYAEVFLGRPFNSREIAVKQLKHKDDVEKQFFQEVDVLVRFVHDNIVPLFGVSQDGPHWCIVYEYMENGTLEDRLECRDDTQPLTSAQRCRIAKGVAKGLTYLHRKLETAFIHRDIKPANILLDYDFSAKIGDCGLAHSGPTNRENTHITTKNLIGTRVYCPPEYMYGEISEKLDAYSFGMVLYEMVTGLPVLDEERPTSMLSSYVRECCRGKQMEQGIKPLVDKRLDVWSIETVKAVFDVAYRLTALEKYERPTVHDVLDEIMAWPAEW